MALTHWLPIPTYTARHKSKFRKQEPYRIENIGEYLVNPIGWKKRQDRTHTKVSHFHDALENKYDIRDTSTNNAENKRKIILRRCCVFSWAGHPKDKLRRYNGVH